MEEEIWKMAEELASSTEGTVEEETESGYRLPIDKNLRMEAEADCKRAMDLIKELYKKECGQQKSELTDIILSTGCLKEMLNELGKTGCLVNISSLPFEVANGAMMEAFMETALKGKEGQAVTYEINSSGGITRKEFMFDGVNLYVLGTNAIWNEEWEPVITYTTYHPIKDWDYTEKGWFLYEYVTPEVPEVSERIDGNAMLRVKPLQEEYREIYEKYLQPIGYQGNNLFLCDWDGSHMEKLDYNGLFQYLYVVKYGKRFENDVYAEGIPKTEFEGILTEYLDITEKQLQKYASYNTETKKYDWIPLNCWNHTLNEFDEAVPEITDVQKNADGTVLLMIDAVCERMGSDKVVSHKLIMKFGKDGDIQYLGNELLGDELEAMPEYQFRCE